jgi:hypothetical protein
MTNSPKKEESLPTFLAQLTGGGGGGGGGKKSN